MQVDFYQAVLWLWIWLNSLLDDFNQAEYSIWMNFTPAEGLLLTTLNSILDDF